MYLKDRANKIGWKDDGKKENKDSLSFWIE